MDIVAFNPAVHRPRWEEFIVASYRSANYVMLSHKFLRWQFFDNPANQTGGYTLWLVEQKGEIIAQLGFVPFQGLTRSSEPVQGAYPINLMVRPEYRSVGLGALLLGRVLKQFPCLVNPGVNEAGATLGEGLGMTISVSCAVMWRCSTSTPHRPSPSTVVFPKESWRPEPVALMSSPRLSCPVR